MLVVWLAVAVSGSRFGAVLLFRLRWLSFQFLSTYLASGVSCLVEACVFGGFVSCEVAYGHSFGYATHQVEEY